jgi:hypothetical protein
VPSGTPVVSFKPAKDDEKHCWCRGPECWYRAGKKEGKPTALPRVIVVLTGLRHRCNCNNRIFKAGLRSAHMIPGIARPAQLLALPAIDYDHSLPACGLASIFGVQTVLD